MKTKKKSTQFKEKALRIIDEMCAHRGTDLTRFSKDGTVIESEECKFIGQIYKIAHAACNTSCEHPEWEAEVEDIYRIYTQKDLL
jgi:hypothetical protein